MRLNWYLLGVILLGAVAQAAPAPNIEWLPRSIDPATLKVEKPPHLRGQDLALKALKYQDWLQHKELLVVVGEGDSSRAYPLRLLAAYRVVTDRDEAGPYALSYCVPCGWIRVFRLPKGVEEFSFSGLWSGHGLKPGESAAPSAMDPLFYDPDSGSLFSHKWGKGVTGPLEGTELVEMSYHLARVRSLNNEEDFQDLPVMGPVGDSLYYLDKSISPRLTMDLFEGPHLLLRGAPYLESQTIRQKADGPGGGEPAAVVDGETFRDALRQQPKPQSLKRYPGIDTAEPVLAFWLNSEPVALPLVSLRRREGQPLLLKRGEQMVEVWMDLDGFSWKVSLDGEEIKSWPMRLGAWAFGKEKLWLPLQDQDS